MDIKLIDRILALGNLMGHARMAHIETDMELRISAWNQGAKELFSHSENEALGQFLNELIPVNKETLIQCTQAGRMSISHGNGQEQKRQCDITYAPIINLQAEKLGIALLATNITDKSKNGTRLKQKKQQIEEIFGVAPIGIYHVNLEGNLTMANSEYAWMLGHESSDAVLSQVKDFATQVFFDQEKAEEFMFNILEADQIDRFRCRLKRKDNSYLWALCYAKTTRNEFGRTDGYNGFSIDISTTVRMEEELEKANEQLKVLSGIDGLTQIPNRRKFDKYVTLSLGIASAIPGHDTSAKELVALADKALYEAKEGGRNQSIGKTLKKIQGSV